MADKAILRAEPLSAPRLLHRRLPVVLFVFITLVYGAALYPVLGFWAVLLSASFAAWQAHIPKQTPSGGDARHGVRLEPEGIVFIGKRGRKERLLPWSEIERVKLMRFWGFSPLPVMFLKRRRQQSFWTMKFSEKRTFRLWWTIWRRRAFREALRSNVPGDCVDPRVWNTPIPRNHSRFRWIAGVMLIALGTMLAITAPTRSSLFRWAWMGAVLALIIAWLGAFNRPRLLRGGTGLVLMLLPSAYLPAFIGAGSAGRLLDRPLAHGISAALAALLISVGFLLLLMPRRTRAWIAAPVLMAVIGGFLAGWLGVFGYGGIKVMRIPHRQIPLAETPWTPGSDAFVLRTTQPILFLDDESESIGVEESVSWYRADGSQIREIMFRPRRLSYVLTVGQDVALTLVRADGEEPSLMAVTKSGNVKELLTAEWIRFPHRTASPNRQWLTMLASWGETEEDYKEVWYRVNVNSLSVLPLPLLTPTDGVTEVAINDDGALFWLNGEKAVLRATRSFSLWQPQNPSDTLEELGRPFSLWYDDPSDAAPPEQLHLEQDVWRDYKVVDNMQSVYATRLVCVPEPHEEHVCLRLQDGTVDIEPATRYYDIEPVTVRVVNGKYVWPPETKRGSPDGRFWVELEEGIHPLFGRLSITDTRTGRRRNIRHAVTYWRESYFSPDGRWLLLPGASLTRDPWILDPVKGLKYNEDTLVVDLEAAFPTP